MPPVSPEAGPVAEYAFKLRALRQAAGLTYSELAERAYYAKTSLWEAEQGLKLPTLACVRAHVRGCGATKEEMKRWEKDYEQVVDDVAHLATAAVPPPASLIVERGDPPDPRKAVTPQDFLTAMIALRTWASMSLRNLAAASTALGRRLPPATVSDMCKSGKLPRFEIAEVYLRAHGLDEAQLELWLDVYRLITTRQDQVVDGPDGTAAVVDISGPGRRVHAQQVVRLVDVDTPTIRRLLDVSDDEAERWMEQISRLSRRDERATKPRFSVRPTRQIRDWVLLEGQWVSTDDLNCDQTLWRRLNRRVRRWLGG